jgi:hypothetical protein
MVTHQNKPPVVAPAPHEIRAIAVEAEVHPVTAAKVLAGRPTRALQRERVLRVLRAKGLEHLASATPPTRRRPAS